MSSGSTRLVRIIPKKTTVSGKIPSGTTGNDLSLLRFGEIGSNLTDYKLWGYNGTNVFEYGSKSYLGLSGGTISGNTNFIGNLSASTIFSGGTNLETIINNAIAASTHTFVQPGANIQTGGTSQQPIISTVDSPSFNNISFSGTATGGNIDSNTISASTIYIGGVDISGSTTSLKTKSGIAPSSGFTGNPDKYTVTFITPFPSNNYSVTITGEKQRSWTIESKSASGFVINSNANPPFTGNVFWQAIEVGES